MKKTIYASLVILLILSGCGGGAEEELVTRTTDTKTDIGNKTGNYNLWEYIVPSSTVTYDFVEKVGEINNAYSTTFTKQGDVVTEVSDYAENEKTIYTKKSDRVLVVFEKDGKENGEYSLNLTANIGDMITLKESTCKLAAHYNEKTIDGKTFSDIIEINCGGKPGFYRKGTGEIAQTGTLSTNGHGDILLLSN